MSRSGFQPVLLIRGRAKNVETTHVIPKRSEPILAPLSARTPVKSPLKMSVLKSTTEFIPESC